MADNFMMWVSKKQWKSVILELQALRVELNDARANIAVLVKASGNTTHLSPKDQKTLNKEYDHITAMSKKIADAEKK